MKRSGGLIFVFAILFLAFNFASAQDGTGTMDPSPSSNPSSTPTSDPGTGTIPQTTAAPIGVPQTTRTQSPNPTLSPTPQSTVSISPAPLPEEQNNNLGWLIPAIVAVLGILSLGFFIIKGKLKKDQADENRCSGIKELLEQKKKELEDYLKSLPQEKAKELAIEGLKNDEKLRKAIETIEGAKEKYDKFKEAIELLEKKYDLCMLELPSWEKAEYKGTIIESSLIDKDILKSLKIEKAYPLEDWLLNDVSVSERQIESLGKYLNDGPWYMHFWMDNKEDVIVVFKDKSFKIKYSDKRTWNDAINYGKSKGIPEEQLDFTVK